MEIRKEVELNRDRYNYQFDSYDQFTRKFVDLETLVNYEDVIDNILIFDFMLGIHLIT
jgi:hypothetical protein